MICKGNILYIHSLDRFSRNKEKILGEWNAITKKFEADIIILDMSLHDGTFMADLVSQTLS